MQRRLGLRRAHHEDRAEQRQREDEREDERARHAWLLASFRRGRSCRRRARSSRVTVTVLREIGSSIHSVTVRADVAAHGRAVIVGLAGPGRSGSPSPSRSQRSSRARRRRRRPARRGAATALSTDFVAERRLRARSRVDEEHERGADDDADEVALHLAVLDPARRSGRTGRRRTPTPLTATVSMTKRSTISNSPRASDVERPHDDRRRRSRRTTACACDACRHRRAGRRRACRPSGDGPRP